MAEKIFPQRSFESLVDLSGGILVLGQELCYESPQMFQSGAWPLLARVEKQVKNNKARQRELTLVAIEGYLLHTEGNQVVHRSKAHIDQSISQ